MNRPVSAIGFVCAGLLLAQLVAIPSTAAAATTHKCLGRPATIVGTPGNDVLVGTPGFDVIVGLRGRDTISGLGGDDFFCGGRGADTIYAVKAGAPLAGAGEDPWFKGGRGNDKLYADSGNSEMWPGPGNDLMDNGSFDSEHDAGANYSPSVTGVGGSARGPIVADVGRITCQNPPSPSTCTRRGTVTSIDGTDTLINMQQIIGSPYDDVISTGPMRAVGGGDGNDTITIRRNGTVEFFGAGNGDDTIINHSHYSCGESEALQYGGPGNDTYYGSATKPGAFDNGFTGGCFVGGDGNDSYYGNIRRDYFDGGAGDDTFFGRAGADKAIGGDGADVLNGNGGPDTILANDGVSGNDTANGGPGTDSCTVDPGDIVKNCES
jgi:Ca2+-binding RTX toxin-like protein